MTVPWSTVVLACLRSTWRIGAAMCSGDEDRGGHLVEERLEDVVVGLVDEEHAGRSLPQGAGRRETAEAPAHDDDSRVACRRRRNGIHGQFLRSWPVLLVNAFSRSPGCLAGR